MIRFQHERAAAAAAAWAAGGYARDWVPANPRYVVARANRPCAMDLQTATHPPTLGDAVAAVRAESGGVRGEQAAKSKPSAVFILVDDLGAILAAAAAATAGALPVFMAWCRLRGRARIRLLPGVFTQRLRNRRAQRRGLQQSFG